VFCSLLLANINWSLTPLRCVHRLAENSGMAAFFSGLTKSIWIDGVCEKSVEGAVLATDLYPDMHFTTIEEFLQRFVWRWLQTDPISMWVLMMKCFKKAVRTIRHSQCALRQVIMQNAASLVSRKQTYQRVFCNIVNLPSWIFMWGGLFGPLFRCQKSIFCMHRAMQLRVFLTLVHPSGLTTNPYNDNNQRIRMYHLPGWNGVPRTLRHWDNYRRNAYLRPSVHLAS
jgi:hypothetical protein